MSANLRLFVLAVVCTLVIAATRQIAAQTAAEDSTTAWFVELDTSVATFRARAQDSGIPFTERYVYQRLWRGLSVQATAEAASQLSRLRGVRTVYPASLVDVERDHIIRTLEQVRGNKAVAARILGVSRRAFYRQLERHGLHQRIPMSRRPENVALAAE